MGVASSTLQCVLEAEMRIRWHNDANSSMMLRKLAINPAADRTARHLIPIPHLIPTTCDPSVTTVRTRTLWCRFLGGRSWPPALATNSPMALLTSDPLRRHRRRHICTHVHCMLLTTEARGGRGAAQDLQYQV